jgi:hypothetical protein
VCNQSFERINQSVLNKLNDASVLYSTHFHVNDPSRSLFECWLTDPFNNPWQSGLDVTGVTWGVVPGLFLRYDGSEALDFEDYPNTPFVVENNDPTINPKAFVGDNGSGLTLTQDANNIHGFDLSPPTTKFAENVNAQHGSSYVALFDFENDNWQAHPSLLTELKYPLEEGVEYTVSLAWCKMNLIGYLKDTEGWDAVNEGKIKVFVCNSELNQTQNVLEIEVNNNDWTISSQEFEAHHASTHLLIEYNPILSNPLNTSSKIAGAFVDNIKLYEACETPENMCDNANYRRDLLDVKLEEAELASEFGDMKTIRAYYLENVKRFEMKIYKGNDPSPIRTIDLWYPETDYWWDGRNDAGTLMSEDNDYKAIINAVSNDCYHITNADEKNFELELDFTISSAEVGLLSVDGNASIGGLDNIHDINVKISSTSGQELYNFDVHNPRPVIAFSIESLVALPGNQTIVEGAYVINATISNNCGTSEISGTKHIGHQIPDAGPQYNEYYDYASLVKGDFACPFNIEYKHNYLAPMNCCEGNLYLHDVEIWNDWNVQIWNTIYAGPNVVFAGGVANNLIAGQEIVLLPDETGVVINDETVLDVGVLICTHCKSVFVPATDETLAANTSLMVLLSKDSLERCRSNEIQLFPNPISGDEEIILLAGLKDFDEFKLVLSTQLGKSVEIKITTERADKLIIKPVSTLSAGVYYLYFESNGERRTFSLVVR